MDMRAIAEMMAPSTTAHIDKVKRKPTPGAVLGLPFSLVSDVARPALSVLDEGVGALAGIGQQHPGVGRLVGALESGVMAANGDPYYQQRSKLIDAQAATQGSQAGFFDARAQGLLADADLTRQQAGLLGMFSGAPPIGGLAQPAHGPWAPGMEPVQGGQFPGITDEMLAAMTLGGMGSQAGGLRQIRSDSRAYDKDMASRAKDLRTQFIKEQAVMPEMHAAYQGIVNMTGNYVGPEAMTTLFAKLLDPGSVVRPEESRAIREAGGLWAQIEAKLKGLEPGAPIPEDLRNSIIENAQRLYNIHARDNAYRREQFSRYAGTQVDDSLIEDITAGYRHYEPIEGAAGSPPPGSGGSGEPAMPTPADLGFEFDPAQVTVRTEGGLTVFYIPKPDGGFKRVVNR